jgi:hypothetical protein
MKNLVLNTLIFILSSIITINLSASEIPFLVKAASNTDNMNVVLDLSKMSEQTVKCQITDRQGMVIFSEEIHVEEGVFKPYNLGNLDIGTYEFKVFNKSLVAKYDIEIKTSGVSVHDNNDVTYKPSIRLKQDKSIDFQLLSLGKEVAVELINNNGDVLYQKSYENQSTISKRLILKELNKGQYTVKVNVGEETFYEYLSI